MLHLSYSSEAVMKLDYQIILKFPTPLTLLAGSDPGHEQTKSILFGESLR